MASTQEILKQIDAALELWSTHRVKSKYDEAQCFTARQVTVAASPVCELVARLR